MKRFNQTIVVRVSDEMHEDLERDAEENGRTLTQSVRFYIRKGLERKEQ